MYLRKIGKKWYYTVPVTLSDGTKSKKERVGGRTKKEAEEAYKNEIRRMDRFGRIQALKEITVKEYFQEWLTNYVEVNLSLNTIDSYTGMLENHIYPAIGKHKLYLVKTITLQKMLNDMKIKYKKSTLSLAVSVLKKGFRDAVVVYDYLDKNPTLGLIVPKYDDEDESTIIYPFTKAQVDELFRKFPADHHHYVPMCISYYTGMRIGEILALKWEDIDFENNTILVHKTQYDKKGEAIIKARTKNHKSRIVAITNELVEILKMHRDRHRFLKKQFKSEYQETGFVCVLNNGQHLTSNNMRYLNMYCRNTFGEGYCIHSLRHTHATLLLENGIDLDYVSKRLGHSDIKITSSTYSHITAVRDEAALEIIEKAF